MVPFAAFGSPQAMVILAASQALGHVLNWYVQDKNRTQQRELAELRKEEAQRAYANMAKRDEDLQGYAIELEEVRSQHRIEELHLTHEHDMQLVQVRGQIRATRQIETERRHRELANSPFAYALDEVREKVAEHTGNGTVPVFLLAPFHYEYPADRLPAFTIALRQTWRRAPWADTMNVFDGLITRPLSQPDLDLQTIRLALHDLPVVVVHGHVQANARLWISLTTWNVGDTTGTRVLDVDLAPLMLPTAEEDSPQRRLAFEDSAAGAVSLLAGTYAEWFHILSTGRVPRMHTQLPAHLAPLSRALALNSAAVYDVAASRGLVSDLRAAVAQATILAEAGLTDQSVATLRDALNQRSLDQSALTELTELAAALRRLEASPVGEQLGQPIEDLQLRILLTQPGMKEFP